MLAFAMLVVFPVLVVLVGGCSRAPAEPEPPASTTSVSTAPAVAPLQWTVPGSWTTQDVPRSGPQKAGYRIPQVGNDKEEATLEIYFFGTGANGSPDKQFSTWFGQFDGNVGSEERRVGKECRSRLSADDLKKK